MSAARRPSTAELGPDPRAEPKLEGAGPAPGPEDDGWALLDALRRRLEDQNAQTRKTQAQVTQLADSVAALVELGRRRSRWLNLNSFIAYLIFTILLGGAFYFVFQSRAREVVAQRDHAIADRDRAYTDRDAAVKRADAADATLAAERTTATKVAAASAVDNQVKAAAAALRAGRTNDVIAPLEKALEQEAPGARAAEMHYLVGMAYSKTNALDKSISHLAAAVNAEVAEEDARFQLASAEDRIGQWAKARAEYDKFATAHPQSTNAVFAMRRSATLAHMPATAPWNAPAKPGAPAVAPGAPTVAPGAAPAAATPTAPAPAAQ